MDPIRELTMIFLRWLNVWDVRSSFFPSSLVLVEYFENELRRVNPALNKISYNVNEIFYFIDNMKECNMLVYVILVPFPYSYENNIQAFVPAGKNVIKQRILQYLNSTTRI